MPLILDIDEAGADRGDFLGLHVIDKARKHGFDVFSYAHVYEVGDGVKDDNRRLEFIDVSEHIDEMHLQAEGHGTQGTNLEQSLIYPGPEVDANRAHVADDLAGGLLEGKPQAALAACDGGALKQMLLPFSLGLGGPLGAGTRGRPRLILTHSRAVTTVESTALDDVLASMRS